ncbi:MAG: hypothetical protein PHO54_06310 [Candidatus Peribacteraceae bacterium]|nr:hypothetical protein [Candidatus Peribacteraceae bacterium]
MPHDKSPSIPSAEHHEVHTFLRVLPIIFFVILLPLMLTACGSSPADKVRQKEAESERWNEESGFNECMRRVKLAEQQRKDCVLAKLREKGITDGVYCRGESQAPDFCYVGVRAVAEDKAQEACDQEVTYATTLFEGECRELLFRMP